MATHSSIFARRIHAKRSLVGYSPWDCKESDWTEQLTFSLLQLKENIDDLSGSPFRCQIWLWVLPLLQRKLRLSVVQGWTMQRQVVMMSATPC